MSSLIYDNSSGYIVIITNLSPADAVNMAATGQSCMEGLADRHMQYILNGAITDRPTQATTVDKTSVVANGVDVVTVTGAPAGSTITAKGTSTTASGGCANPDTFSTQVADTYELTVSCWPYLDFVTTVIAG